MTPSEVREIVREEMGLIKLIPKINTSEVCKVLGVSRDWVRRNRDVLGGGVRTNLRGDLEFETKKVMNYKQKLR